MKSLRTRNIFIDTSVFISHSYSNDNKIKQLSHFASKGKIKIYQSEIVTDEIKQRIRLDLQSAKTTISDYHKKIKQKARILNQLTEFSKFFEKPDLDVDDKFKIISEGIEVFVKNSSATNIKVKYASIEDVFEQYFNSQFPFNTGDKKREFPDAFILSSIDNYAAENKLELYLLSYDKDMLSYESKRIHPIKNLSGILDFLSREEHEEEPLNLIQKLYTEERERLTVEISSSFEAQYYIVEYDYEITHFEIKQIELTQYDIVYLDDRVAILELEANISFYCDVQYDDYSFASHDNEDDAWYGIELKSTSLEINTKLPIELRVDLAPPAGVQFASIEIEDIDFPHSSIITDKLDGYL